METSTRNVVLTVPPGPVAVAVYAVELFGATTTEPFGGSAPILLSMATLSVFDDVQLSVVLSPWVMLGGVALNEIVGGNTTVTVVPAVIVPAGPTAVAV